MSVRFQTGVKRKISILLALLFVLACVFPELSESASAAQTVSIASWNPTGAPSTAKIPADNNENAYISMSNKDVPAFDDFAAGYDKWKTLGTEGYYLIELSTKGYENITFSWTTKGSNTSPKNFEIEYNTDGTENFQSLGELNLLLASTEYTFGPVMVPNGADMELLRIRVRMKDTVSIKGEVVANGGNNYIIACNVTGTLMDTPEASTTPAVTDAPETSITPVVTDIPETVLSLADVYHVENDTIVTTTGQVTAIFGKNGSSLINIILQDTIGGEIVGLQVYARSKASQFQIGTTVKLTGSKTEYGGVVQLQDITSVEQIAATAPIGAQEVTIEQLLEVPDSYLSEYVCIKNATLGAYNSNGSTKIYTETASIPIYRAAGYPEGLTEGSKATVYAVFSKYENNGNITFQLRNGYSTEYVPEEQQDITPTPSITPAATITPTPSITPAEGDPIADTDFEDGVLNIKQLYETEQTAVRVKGQVAFIYGSKGSSLINIILQDIIDGEIIGLQIYDGEHADSYHIGDIVTVTGSKGAYGGVTQISDVSDVTVNNTAAPFAPQELTIAELLADSEQYISEYVLIKNAVLGAYNGSGTTTISDGTGSIGIYKGAAYPSNLTEGKKADIYAVFSKYVRNDDTKYQLRNAASSDYVSAEDITINTDITLKAVSWAGTENIEGTECYADLYEDNDQLNQSARIFLSNGNKPLIANKTSENYNYYLGSTGLKAEEYYQIEFPSTGYGAMKMTFSMKASSTAAKAYTLSYYNSEEDKYTDLQTFTLSEKSKWEQFSIDLPECLNHLEKVTLRLTAGSVSFKNTAPAATGNHYFNGIVITANPVDAADITSIVTAVPGSGSIAAGETVTLSCKTSDAVIYYSLNGQETQVYSAQNPVVVNELPARLTVYATASGRNNSISVSYDYTQKQVPNVKMTPNGGAVAQNAKVTLSCEDSDAVITYSMDAGATWNTYTDKITLSELPAEIWTKAEKAGCLSSEIVKGSFTLRENKDFNIYFGQIHSHTTYSDGQGTCEEAFAEAREAEALDFFAVTDHSNSFDNPDTATLLDGSMSEEWIEGHNLAKEYTDDEFVCLYGYEMTWSNGLGHINTYNSQGFVTRNQSLYKTKSTALANYYEALKTDPATISQFNHPGTTFGDFSDFDNYDAAIDALITLLEVGNGEGVIGGEGYFPSYEYYTRALDKGWHVAPTNNQDNHKGNFGDSNTARTVILADSLTEENIYDALRNMRVYATEDNDLHIKYTLNDEICGTVLEQEPSDIKINVDISDETDSAIGTVEVIVDGGITAAKKVVSEKETVVTFELEPDYSYYYIRIVQPDGDIAVTAPVWTKDVEAAGISSFETSVILPIQNEPVDITLNLFNNEAESLQIDSIEFYGNNLEVPIESVNLTAASLSVIESLKTGSYSFNYTYSGIGALELTAVVKGTLGGVQKQYSGKMTLNYVSKDMIAKVIVDGTHYNDYVSGYYGERMTNFAELAAKSNVLVSVVKDEITSEMLNDCELLIISAPAKKTDSSDSGAYTPSHFEPEFIAMVKDYTDHGGKVILCGLADYQDTAEGQSSVEINKLLAAIGATTRINNDEAYDETNNGGQAYRLYLENLNMESPYLSGVTEGQVYSAYSGCTVKCDADSLAAGTTEWLVKGFSTTYSIDSKDDSGKVNSDPETVVPQGEVIMLAKEKLTSGASVFVAGTVFMSNFEVQATLDNAGDLQYANKNIIQNILNELKVELPVTKIAAVREAAKVTEGEIFAVEGWVTAGTAQEGNIFFDTIYLQDETGGIDIFPYADTGLKVGSKVRIVGYTASYQGDIELKVISKSILEEETLNVIEPRKVTTKVAADYNTIGGQLLKVEGKVVSVKETDTGIESFYLQDRSGIPVRIFIDGYITSSTGVDVLQSGIKAGDTVRAAGISYMNPDGACLRVRDRAEIIVTKVADDPTPYEPMPTTVPPESEQEPESLVLDTSMFRLKVQKRYLYIGGTAGDKRPFGIIAPDGALAVTSFSDDPETAKSEYIVRYATSNPNVAGVTEDGMIVAAEEGRATITAVIELSDGSSVVFERNIVVKKAFMYFFDFAREIRVGEKCHFTIRLYGYKESDLKWMTKRRHGVVVGKNYGKTSVTAKAVSAKNDVIYVQLGELVYEFKIKVIK